jgi:hypothetical protein
MSSIGHADCGDGFARVMVGVPKASCVSSALAMCRGLLRRERLSHGSSRNAARNAAHWCEVEACWCPYMVVLYFSAACGETLDTYQHNAGMSVGCTVKWQ